MPENIRRLWLSMALLSIFALKYKNSTLVPGLGAVLGILTFPIWIWYFVPSLLRSAVHELRQKVESARRAPYCGLNIGERNTARRRLWRLRGRPLKLTGSQGALASSTKCSLLELPLEIRQQIWSELLMPANRISIDYSGKDARLYSTIRRGDMNVDCTHMLKLLKLNRFLYQETSSTLYKINTFCFTRYQTGDDAWAPARLVAFTHSILPQHVEFIRHIRLDVHLSWDRKRENDDCHLHKSEELQWIMTCNALKQMSGLVSLRIRMFARYQGTCVLWTGRQLSLHGRMPEQNILAYLSGVRAKSEFVVEVPWTTEVIDELQNVCSGMKLIGHM